MSAPLSQESLNRLLADREPLLRSHTFVLGALGAVALGLKKQRYAIGLGGLMVADILARKFVPSYRDFVVEKMYPGTATGSAQGAQVWEDTPSGFLPGKCDCPAGQHLDLANVKIMGPGAGCPPCVSDDAAPSDSSSRVIEECPTGQAFDPKYGCVVAKPSTGSGLTLAPPKTSGSGLTLAPPKAATLAPGELLITPIQSLPSPVKAPNRAAVAMRLIGKGSPSVRFAIHNTAISAPKASLSSPGTMSIKSF